MKEPEYIQINRQAWNSLVPAHLKSDFYEMDAFLKGKNSLKEIEMPLLGDLKDKKVLHLQCHFGQDSLSLARMGAEVTGVDFSDQAIKTAEELNTRLGLDVRFICCDVYSLPDFLDDSFDLVFSSYGTIGWLPDIKAWAAIVEKYLKPGGRFVFAEFHPVVWMFDEDFAEVKYRYFNDAVLEETETGSYADKESEKERKFMSWNHGLADVISSLLATGLHLEFFEEYDFSPHNCFQHTVEVGESRYRIRHLDDKIPMTYALRMVKPANR